jgi:hypothetical protein
MNMKTLLLLLLILPLQLFSQTKYIELKNNQTGRIVKIEERKRVEVVAENKESYSGRVQIIDTATVMIGKSIVKLEDIQSIRKNSVGNTIARSGLFFGGGVLLAVAPFAVIAGEITFAAITGSAGLTVVAGGITLPSITQKHKNKKWTYRITDL